MDKFDKSKRSLIMSRVKGKDTKPEVYVRSIVHRLGFRFRKNCSDLPGKPDIVLSKHHKAILVHGCFWHGHKKCSRAVRPESNKAFWSAKLDKNIVRDRKNVRALISLGWKVLIIWQCEIKNAESLTRKIYAFLQG